MNLAVNTAVNQAANQTANLAVNVDNLQPVGQIDLTTPLIIAGVLGILIAIALIAGAVILSRPRRNRDKPQPRGAHLSDTAKTAWHARIDSVIARYHAGDIDRETAFIELAAICRDIASAHTGRDLHAHTLTDIRREPRNPATRTGLDTLRMTIAALYPPEFADAAVDMNARNVSVDDAAGWASTLVERWGR
ncbi:hypothetical protein KIH75_02795 [Bifidobacterium sp. 64T4]|nr:hypothetical protein [Bifidobacterium pongonis]